MLDKLVDLAYTYDNKTCFNLLKTAYQTNNGIELDYIESILKNHIHTFSPIKDNTMEKFDYDVLMFVNSFENNEFKVYFLTSVLRYFCDAETKSDNDTYNVVSNCLQGVLSRYKVTLSKLFSMFEKDILEYLPTSVLTALVSDSDFSHLDAAINNTIKRGDVKLVSDSVKKSAYYSKFFLYPTHIIPFDSELYQTYVYYICQKINQLHNSFSDFQLDLCLSIRERSDYLIKSYYVPEDKKNRYIELINKYLELSDTVSFTMDGELEYLEGYNLTRTGIHNKSDLEIYMKRSSSFLFSDKKQAKIDFLVKEFSLINRLKLFNSYNLKEEHYKYDYLFDLKKKLNFEQLLKEKESGIIDFDKDIQDFNKLCLRNEEHR